MRSVKLSFMMSIGIDSRALRLNRIFLGISIGLALLHSWQPGKARAQTESRTIAKVTSESPKTLSPGQWGNVAVTVSNVEREPIKLQVFVAFASDVEREFTRTIWVPARAHRKCWLPVQAPHAWPARGWEIRARFLRENADGKMVVLRLESSDALFETTYVGKTKERHPTLVLLDETGKNLAKFYEVIQDVRQHATLSPKLMGASGIRPSTPQWLDGVSIVIVAEDIIDAGAIESIRRWTRSGGRLWIMADRVSDETMLALLGDAAPAVVGRETLNTFVFKRESPSLEQTNPWHFDEPHDFCMLATSEGETSFTVNDWPAAITMPFNEGSVVFTTVDMGIWPGTVRMWLADVVYTGLDQKSPPADAAWPLAMQQVAKVTLAEQVGKGVPSAPLVFGILIGVIGVFVGGGVWLMRIEQLDKLALLVPVTSLAATAALLLIGRSVRDVAPPTVARLQVAHVAPGTDTLNIHGATVAFYPEVSSDPVTGGSAIVEGAENPEVTSNTGMGQWIWEGASIPPGARLYHVQDEKPSPLRVVATFSERGIEGRVSPPPKEAQNAVLAGRGFPCVAVHWGDDGSFWAGPEDTLGMGQFNPTAIVDDAGRRQQRVLEAIWGPGARRPLVADMELGFWTKPIPVDVQWPAVEKEFGDCLVVAPIQWMPMEPGTRVKIPGSAMSMRIRSSLFSMQQQRWVAGANGGSFFRVNFVLPSVARQLRPERGELVVKLALPGRQMRILDRAGAELALLNGNVGVVNLDIDSPASLAVEAGQVSITFEVLEAEGRSADAEWSVDYMYLHLEGTTQ